MKNDDRVSAAVYPPSYYGCQELGYCPNKQVRLEPADVAPVPLARSASQSVTEHML